MATDPNNEQVAEIPKRLRVSKAKAIQVDEPADEGSSFYSLSEQVRNTLKAVSDMGDAINRIERALYSQECEIGYLVNCQVEHERGKRKAKRAKRKFMRGVKKATRKNKRKNKRKQK